jgi:hypothetical protein
MTRKLPPRTRGDTKGAGKTKVEEVIRRMSFETERLAWLVLQITNRTQAKGSTTRLIFPRDPEVLQELGRTLGIGLADRELLPVESYLLEHGYVALVDIGLSTGSYSITTAGFEWLDGTSSEPPVISQELYDQAQTSDGTDYEAPELSERRGDLLQEVGTVVFRGERDRLLQELERQRLQIERLEAELREARNHWWRRLLGAPD